MNIFEILHCLTIVQLMVKLFGQGFGTVIDIADVVRMCPFY